MKSHSLTLSYQTTNTLIYQAASQKDTIVNEIVLSLMCHHLESACFPPSDLDNHAAAFRVMNQGSTFTMRSADILEALNA